MKQAVYIAILFLFTPVGLFAQPRIEKSEPIAEPAENFGYGAPSYDKLLLLKNGKTCYVHYFGTGGIDLNIYNPQRKLISTSQIASELWDVKTMDGTTVLGTYEISNELVIFLQQTVKKHPILYRLRINTDDGKLIKEDIIATIKNDSHLEMKVAKDQKSGCYAVIFYETADYNGATEDAIKVLHFDERHTLLSTARLTSPDQDIRNITLLDAAVQGNKSVYVSTYYKGNDKDDSKIYISRLNEGDTAVTTKPINFTEKFHESYVQMLYNYTTNNLQMLIVTIIRSTIKEEANLSFLCSVNTNTLDLVGVSEISNDKITAYARDKQIAETSFTGIPQWLILNRKGEPTIIKRSAGVVNRTDSRGKPYTIIAVLTDVGISEMTMNGIEKQSYLLPQSGSTTAFTLSPRYIRDLDRKKIGTHYSTSQQYAFRYLEGRRNNYVIHHSYRRAINSQSQELWTGFDLDNINLNTAFYTMRNGNVALDYLFGAPEGNRDRTTCYLNGADQNEDGLFTTIIIEKKGKTTEARIAWVTFE